MAANPPLERLEDRLMLAAVPFQYQQVSPDDGGDCKMAADFDGDGYADLAVGGGTDLVWYRYPSWTPTVIALAEAEFTTDGQAADVDGDGNADIVIPSGSLGDNLMWFENPSPDSNPADGSQWVVYTIGSGGGYVHDVEVADFDGDGRLDVAARNNTRQVMIFFQVAPDQWQKVLLDVDPYYVGIDGLGSGDVDGDGKTDLVLCGVWLRNPCGGLARNPAGWTLGEVGDVPASYKAAVGDIDGDGRADIVYCCAEAVGDVAWWSCGGDYSGAWTQHVIAAGLDRSHTLQLGDVNNDGMLDVLAGQTNSTIAKEVILFLNDGQGQSWTRQVVAQTGIHNGMLVDIGNDGKLDIFGSNYAASQAGEISVDLWVNCLGGDDGGPDTGDSISSATTVTLSPFKSISRNDAIGNGAYGVSDVDLYRFTTRMPALVELELWARRDGSALEGYLRLFNSSGQQIASSFNAEGGDPCLSLLLLPGTYYVGISGNPNRNYDPNTCGSGTAGSTGCYRLEASTYLPGDANCDGRITFADYQIMEAHFGMTCGATWLMGDFNGDQAVSFADYQELEANFGIGDSLVTTAGLEIVAAVQVQAGSSQMAGLEKPPAGRCPTATCHPQTKFGGASLYRMSFRTRY